MYLKAITSEDSHVSFVSPTYKLARLSFEYFCDEFADKLSLRVSRSSQIVTTSSGKKIKFTSAKNGLFDLRGLMLVDNAHNFPQNWLSHYIEKTDNEIVFTSKPYECGWRNPIYENGMVQRDERGRVLTFKSSWDNSLVDWGLCDQDKCVSENWNEAAFSTKACPSLYLPFVRVVSGYDVKGNHFLLENNPCYIKALDSLPPKDKIPLEGRWVL